MSKCTACNEDLPYEFVTCAARKCKLHFECSGITEATYRTMGNRKNTYKCRLCRKTDSSQEPATRSENSEISDTPDSKLEAIVQRAIDKQTQKIDKKMEDVMESINFCSSKIDDFVQQILKLETKIVEVEKENKELKQKNADLEKKVKQNSIQIEEIQQYSRNRNIQIDGIPELKDESLNNIINKIAIKIDEPLILNTDLQAIHRVPRRAGNQQQPNPIVVQFTNRQKRDAILEKSKQKKLSAADIIDNVPTSPIYINEHLTPYLKNILHEAKIKRTKKEVKYVWVKNGKVYVRKNENTPAIIINAVEALHNL